MAAISFEQPLQGLAQQAAQSLSWINLVSGQFFKEEEHRFSPEKRADRLLLENLKYVRQRLLALDLNKDTTHDLLARIIFIQFLFDREDTSGVSALNKNELSRLHTDGKLVGQYSNLEEILNNYDDSYRLFRFLNTTFNGDLFPGKGATLEEQEEEWKAEQEHVKPKHLRLLASFIGGNEKMNGGQRILWRQYSFNAIPIEFISSIYEEFVKGSEKLGIHYTPPFLVDFMLDGVLPWDSAEWNLKILDPACGSGVFLVKAYQRLIHRWKNAHQQRQPKPEVLRGLLKRNLFGVDKDKEAVRVASFSLYLAMCDQINPRDYWTQVHFPPLRGHRLVESDFFDEEQEGIRTDKDAHYDLIVGNAPWGNKLLTEKAHQWAHTKEWPIANKQIGTLFLAKSLALLKTKTGQVCMVQPAGAVLFNRNTTAKAFQDKLFGNFKVHEVVNLSALRFQLFPNAIGPACIITTSTASRDYEPILYICPKPLETNEDEYRVVIEPNNIHWVYFNEKPIDMRVWTTLMWGGNRDLRLINNFKDTSTLQKLKTRKCVQSRRGFVKSEPTQERPELKGKPLLEAEQFPNNTFLYLDVNLLDRMYLPFVYEKDSTDFSAFDLPQAIIKTSWKVGEGRFRAALTKPDKTKQGVICSRLYVSVHTKEQNSSLLDMLCLTFNSIFAVYFLLLTSGRFASYIPEALVAELLDVPIAEHYTPNIAAIKEFDDIDNEVRKSLDLRDADWTLIEDLFNYTLPDFKGNVTSPGRQPTRSQTAQSNHTEPILSQYCDYFLRVLKASFGQDKNVCATIYQEDDTLGLPLRLVAIHLDWPERELISTETMSNSDLRSRLQELYHKLIQRPEEAKLYYQRVVRMYDTVDTPHGKVPTIYIIKPDQIRYWTRSMGLHDADEVGGDILTWKGTAEFDASKRVIEVD